MPGKKKRPRRGRGTLGRRVPVRGQATNAFGFIVVHGEVARWKPYCTFHV